MDKLPDELVIHILLLVDPVDVINIQRACVRMRSLARDGILWKFNCFFTSRFETLHRLRLAWESQEARLAELRRAVNESGAAASPFDPYAALYSTDSDVSLRSLNHGVGSKPPGLAHWEPGYPTENIDFHQEYIHRHAPVSARYLQPAYSTNCPSSLELDCLGVGILRDREDGNVQRAVAPLEDGTICLWDISLASPVRGKIVARSNPGLLRGNAAATTSETGAVDNVSIDHHHQKAYIANQCVLTEVDLATLTAVRRDSFPFPITALSSASSDTLLTVGTTNTLHLHDTRVSRPHLSLGLSSRCELIAGSPILPDCSTRVDVPKDIYLLTQPTPLSILHPPTSYNSISPSHSIWVAGRFTYLLHFDRRCWPQLHTPVFSGARTASLSVIPYPFVHPDLRKLASDISTLQQARRVDGMTLLAAGEYKGKGSLEMYAISPLRSQQSSPQPHSSSTRELPIQERAYRNRQSAASSPLLSVAPHGARMVFSDGNGNMKWVERDATSLVRSVNINDILKPAGSRSRASSTASSSSSANTSDSEDALIQSNTESNRRIERIERINRRRTLFADPSADADSDIVQKIVPLQSPHSFSQPQVDSENNDLLIWTGDGKLAMVGFGKDRIWQDFGRVRGRGSRRRRTNNLGDGDVDDDNDDDRDERERERLYAVRMREALERQADETRWVRGLGLGG